MCTIILGKRVSLHTLPILILHFISELMQQFGRDLFRHTSFVCFKLYPFKSKIYSCGHCIKTVVLLYRENGSVDRFRWPV